MNSIAGPARGCHILIDAYGSPSAVLDDRSLIEAALSSSIAAGRVSLLQMASHSFTPQGVTAFALLTESHISIHTWPERRFFTADIYFCGGDIEAAKDALLAALEPERITVKRILRGVENSAAEDAKTGSVQ